MVDSIESLKEITRIQCSDGNWNYDEYMHGMANGLILALSLFSEGKPEYLKTPDKWLKDITDLNVPAVTSDRMEG